MQNKQKSQEQQQQKNPDFKINNILKKIFEKIIRAIAHDTSWWTVR